MATKVIGGRDSLFIAFLNGDGEELWVTGVCGPLRIRGRNLFWDELGDLFGYFGLR